MNNKGFELEVKQTEDKDFINNHEMYMFLNEIFRIGNYGFDKKLTKENFSLFPMDHGLGSIPFINEPRKRKARIMADELIRAYVEGGSKSLVTNITYFKLTDDNGYGVKDVAWLVHDDENFFKDLSGYILYHKEDLRNCLLHVLHVDEENEEFHIHSLKVKNEFNS